MLDMSSRPSGTPGQRRGSGATVFRQDVVLLGMADSDEQEDEAQSTTDSVGDSAEEAIEEEVVIDLESAAEYEEHIESLEDKLEEQREEIDELQDLVVDLSARVADGRNTGVCPECHGTVVKKRRWLRTNTLECTDCGEVYHEY